jgi:hypothetical protein
MLCSHRSYNLFIAAEVASIVLILLWILLHNQSEVIFTPATKPECQIGDQSNPIHSECIGLRLDFTSQSWSSCCCFLASFSSHSIELFLVTVFAPSVL